MLQFLEANWFGIVGIVIGALLSWVTSWFFYKRGNRTKSLSYTATDVAVVWPQQEQADDALKITFHGREVPRATSTTIAIWNSGTDTIDGSDLLEDDPLGIRVKGDARILRGQILDRTRDPIIGDMPYISETELRLRFRYLDAKDGIVVEVLHTGGTNALSVVGTVKGIPGGIRELNRDRHVVWFLAALAIPLVPIVIGMALGILALPAWFVYISYSKPWPYNLIFSIGALALYPIGYLLFKSGSSLEEDAGPLRISGVPDKLAARLGGRLLTMQQLTGLPSPGKRDKSPSE